MESGKIFLIVLVTAISTYAALTAWPAIRDLLHPQPAIVTAGTPPPLTVAAVSPVTSSSSVRNPTASIPSPSYVSPAVHLPPQGMSLAGTMPSTVPAWDISRSRYARKTVTMRAKPGGEPLKPPSLNRSPLTILEGTRLLPVQEQGEWVMVQSPSAILGWIRTAELTANRPPVVDHNHWR
jgi:hypothetical protein